MTTWQVKNIRDELDESDGLRVLVDRLWPRGISKERAALDVWLKEVAPSTELRTWFHHGDGAGHFADFSNRYATELETNSALDELITLAQGHPVVTLLTSTHDRDHNHAIVLRDTASGR